MSGPATSPQSRPSRWKLRGLLVLALVGILAYAGWWGYRAVERRAALELARTGRFSDAAPLLESESRRGPNDVGLLRALSRGYLDAGDPNAARPFLDRWCTLTPDSAEPFRLRLDLHRKEQRFDLALPDALHLLRLDPADADLPLTVAGLYFATGDFDQAEKRCREVLALQPKRRDGRRLLADILRARGQRDEAGKLLDALLGEKPDDTAVMIGRGSLYLETGQADRAVPLLEAVVRLDPRRQRTGRYQLVRAYEQAGRAADARRVQAELHSLQEAEVLKDALDSQPGNVDVQVRAARSWLGTPRAPEGLDLLARVLERHPNHPGAHAALADYYDRIGQSARAAEHRERAGEGR